MTDPEGNLTGQAQGRYYGCGDSMCVFGPPVGQHTNGGCRCFKDILDRERARDLRLGVKDLRARLSLAETGRLEAENERLRVAEAEAMLVLETTEAQLGRASEAARVAEGKAALADEAATMIRESNRVFGRMRAMWHRDNNWLARYDALTPATDAAERTTKLVCRFYPNEPCPLPNVHCSAPECMIAAEGGKG